MYNNYKRIFDKLIDTEAIMAEAMTIAGDRPSVDLVLALTIKAISEKMQIQVDELKTQIFLNPGKSLQQLEDEGKFDNVVSLTGARNIKDANESLQHCVSAWGDMTPEMQLQTEAKAEFDKERQHAAALNKDITLGKDNDYDSKNIYLHTFYGPGKIKMIVGLHAIGHAGQYQYTLQHSDGRSETKSTDFMIIDSWGNEYDKDHNVVGRGSFRLNTNDIDEVVKEYESEGWVRCEKPGKVKL